MNYWLLWVLSTLIAKVSGFPSKLWTYGYSWLRSGDKADDDNNTDSDGSGLQYTCIPSDNMGGDDNGFQCIRSDSTGAGGSVSQYTPNGSMGVSGKCDGLWSSGNPGENSGCGTSGK